MLRSLRGLRVQLLLWAIVPLILIVVGVSVLGIVTHQSSMRDLVAQRDAQLAGVAADLLDERLLLHIRLLESVAREENNLPDLPEFDGGLLQLDSEGDIISATPGRDAWSSRNDWVVDIADRVHQSGLAQISDPFFDPVTSRRSLLVAVPVSGGDVLMGLASFSHLGLPTMIANLGTGRRGVTSLVDRRGVIIYHPDSGQEGKSISDPEVVHALNHEQHGATFHVESDGEEMVIGYSPSALTGWGLVVYEPWADAIAPLMRVSEMTPIILVLTAVAALSVIYFGMRYIIRPLQDLEQEATRVAWGEFDAIQKPVGGVEEIETLRRTLNQMTSQIREYQMALRDYLAAITRAEEEERRRVARELHDDTVQNLIALVHRVEMCEKAVHDPSQLAQRFEEVRNLATETLDNARRLIYNLRPAYLDDLGLVAAVNALGSDLEIEHDTLSVGVQVIGSPERLDRDAELAAFRIIQEALTNVIRHARARTVDVRLEFGKGELVITVRDDGIGFSAPKSPQQMVHEGHFGLMGIHERVLRFGGHLSVQSEPDKGTVLVATIPYSCPLLGV
jgi:two-component system sensor histidine kinase UhpB